MSITIMGMGEIPFEYLDLYPNPIDAKTQIGIAAESGVYGFILNKNKFIGPSSYTNPTQNPTNALVNTGRLIGTNLVNTGDMDNVVENNLYENVKTGNQALGLNGRVTNSGNLDPAGIGLIYLCNRHIENNEYDILGEIHVDRFGLTEAVLNLEQGKKVTDPFNPSNITFQNAGNCFSESGVHSHFTFHRTTDQKTINYYHPADNKPVICLEKPTLISGVIPLPLTSESLNECADRPVILIENPELEFPNYQGLEIEPWTGALTLENTQKLAAAEENYQNASDATMKALWKAEIEQLATVQLKLNLVNHNANAEDLQRIGHSSALLSLAERYFAAGNLSQARLVLHAIENSTFVSAQTLLKIEEIWNIAANNESDPSEAELAYLEELAENELNLSSAYARNYLLNFGYDFPPILSHRAIETSEQKFEKGTNLKLSFEDILPKEGFVLFPNPSNGLINMVFSDELESLKKTIQVFSAEGILVKSTTIKAGIKSQTWNFDHLAPGFYYMRVSPEGQRSLQSSFIISKL